MFVSLKVQAYPESDKMANHMQPDSIWGAIVNSLLLLISHCTAVGSSV